MFWNRYFLPSFAALLVVAALNFMGEQGGFYVEFGWFDNLSHFFGGAWVALFVLWLIYMNFFRRFQGAVTFLNITLVLLLAGIAWEVLELYLGFTYLSGEGYVYDTFTDLGLDIFGGLSAFYLFKK